MPIYALTIFTGAFLLFLVQPLIAKYILPWFGGAPSVWTTCMLFFQLLLLAGYGYAHFSARWLKPKVQAAVHLVLLMAAVALLKNVIPSDSWKPADPSDPTLRILGLLCVSIGLPYFVLAATSPLMQHWFSHTNPGVSPFRLYALSNIGSMLALIIFPVYFEAHFTRPMMAHIWGGGLALFGISCGACAWKLWQTAKTEDPVVTPAKQGITAAPAPGVMQKLLWVLLPACASVLLLATTNMICQEVAVIPFLWILPLALYLLSFIICFDSPRWYVRPVFAVALFLSLGSICWALFKGTNASTWFQLGIYNAGLFVCCMVCHGELYRIRPNPRHLTAYYLMIAGGGAIGGVFVALIAPLIFKSYYELQTGLMLCGLLFVAVCRLDGRPVWLRPFKKKGSNKRQVKNTDVRRLLNVEQSVMVTGLLALGIMLWYQTQPLQELSLVKKLAPSAKVGIERWRNFYGVLTVFKFDDDASNMHYVQLSHGRTLHGQEFTDPERRDMPTTYFNTNTGIGMLLKTMPAGDRRIGLIGLGAGTLAAYPEKGDVMRIYEINPDVVTIARTNFTYLNDCKGTVEVVLGDARLSMEREAPQHYDILILDAFNSDAIPVHLLTKEAFEIYERHLNTNGIVAIHISNRNLNLDNVVANIARVFHYHLTIVDSLAPRDKPWMMNASWALLARDKNAERIIDSPSIQLASRPPFTNSVSIPLWTDDYTSLFPIIKSDMSPQFDPAFTDQQCQLAFSRYQQGDTAGAIAQFREALKKMPRSPILLANLAFLLTSCPDPSMRDLNEATHLAERACRVTDYHNATALSTLGVVYSETGRFHEAIQMAEKACAVAKETGEEALVQKNEELLKLYKAGKPFHEAGQR